MNTRLAQERDVPVINAIQNHYIATTHIHFATTPTADAEALQEWRDAAATHPWIVAADEQVLGFARASAWKSRCAYAWSVETSVYLRPEAGGRGLGRALYDHPSPFSAPRATAPPSPASPCPTPRASASTRRSG